MYGSVPYRIGTLTKVNWVCCVIKCNHIHKSISLSYHNAIHQSSVLVLSLLAVEYCQTCPAGYYCPSGTDTPQPCPTGTFNPSVGQNDVVDCTACTAGMACTQVALVEPDTHCYPG